MSVKSPHSSGEVELSGSSPPIKILEENYVKKFVILNTTNSAKTKHFILEPWKTASVYAAMSTCIRTILAMDSV